MSQEESHQLIRLIEGLVDEDADHTTEFLSYLDHSEPTVREAAIWALWNGELSRMLEPLLRASETDADETVRAAAVSVSGRYIYEGLMLDPGAGAAPVRALVQRVDHHLRSILNQEKQPELLRRRALESLSFNTDDELEELIETWIGSANELLRKSAAFAMGRANVDRFSKHLVKAIDDASRMVRIEAIRSVGELGLKKGLLRLVELAKGPDQELAIEAIQALGQIGGPKAESTLKGLVKGGDEARTAAARDSLAEMTGDD